MGNLRGKQRKFVEEWFVDFNGTRAAERAGYAGNDNTLAATASRLLRNAKIRAEISRRFDEMAMPANEVLARLGDQAGATFDDFIEVVELDEDGRSTAIVSLAKAKRRGKLHLIKKLTYHVGGGFTLELHDAQSALMHLDRYHGSEDGKPLEDRQAVRFDLSNLSDSELDILAGIIRRARGDTD